MSSIHDDEDDSRVQRSSDAERSDDEDLQREVFDSSEEDDDDDDEEEIQRVHDGFIVDDEEDAPVERKKKKHKRRHAERERKSKDEDEGLLDEDDLDLVMENSGAASSSLKETSKFKRLKKAPVQESTKKSSSLNDFFSDDEDEEIDDDDDSRSTKKSKKSVGRQVMDELDDFIEDDEFSDLDEDEKREARQRRQQERLKPTELSGIDSEKVDELYDIFGDGEDYAWALEGEDEDGEYRDSETKTELKDIYEPEELKARMLTDNDKVIRDTDVPERFQELRKTIKKYDLSTEDFNFECQWVAYKLNVEHFGRRSQEFDFDAFNQAVTDVLVFISKLNLEVPFIFSHRRDHLLKTTIIGEGEDATTNVIQLLDEPDLWRIIQLDIEFHLLLEKKTQVDASFEALNVIDPMLEDSINNIQTMTDVQDIHDYINFQYSGELKDLGLKKSRNSVYDKIRTDKVFELVDAFGISVKDYAENIVADSKLLMPKDHPISPKDLADQICEDESSLYAKSNQTIEAAKHYFAEEFYNNLKIRKHFRDIFTKYSQISVGLTELGRLKIDKNSPYADFKYAINRTIDDFYEAPDMFLRMLEAESANLIEIRFQAISQDKLFEKLYELIASDGHSDLTSYWNAHRRSALEIATKKLFPLISLNIKETLRRECERLLFFEIRANFSKKIDQAPYTPKRENTGYGDIPRVFALSPGNGSYGHDSIVAAFMNEFGEVVETYKFDENPFIPIDRVAEGEIPFQTRFAEIIQSVQPDVIAINGFNVKTHKLYTKLKEIVNLERLEINGGLIEVIYVNDEIALRFQNSKKAKEQFPDKSTLVRYVIALARYVQSPLLECVSLGDDISTLLIHPYQHLLTEDQLRQAITISLVDIVNMTGLDINKCVTDSYLATLLPYISGLGDRKAFGLLRAVQQHPLFSRQALITNENIRIGSTIFLNCASFLRIPQNGHEVVRAGNDIEPVTLLDDTRIHPEDYALAERMAADALDLDEDQIEELKDAPIGETVIDKLVQQGTGLLSSLILEDYSTQLELNYGKKKRATLQMILEELQEPFLEIRKSFHLLDTEEIFQSLTGDSAQSFHQGLVLPVYLRKVGGNQMICQTSSQIDCFANINDGDEPFYKRFEVGQTIPAQITEVNYGEFTAQINVDQRSIQNQVVRKTFPKLVGKWDFNTEKFDNDLELHKEIQSQAKVRVINHPGYQNFNLSQAQSFLAARERGAYVIRPSSKGWDHITITWKVDNNLFQNIDVVEHDKDSDNSVGKTLTIDNLTYSDLDEIIFNHIGSMVNLINEMLNHEKFHTGSRNDVSKWLETFSKANPQKGAYAFAMNYKKPGYFILLFKTGPTSHLFSWNVKVVPGGFELHSYVYPSVMLLCNGFKTVIKTKPTNRNPQARSGYNNGGSQSRNNNRNEGYGNSGYNNSQGYAGNSYPKQRPAQSNYEGNRAGGW